MLMKAFSMTTIFRKIDRHTLEAKTDDISLVNHSQSELHQIKINEKHLPKLQGYEKHLDTIDERNRYFKTNLIMTYMRIKKQHKEETT